MISIVNTECHVPKTFSDLAKIAAWGRLGLLCAGPVRENLPFWRSCRRAMTATHFCGPPRVKTVLETRFAKASAGDGFGEPTGRECEHDAPFASSAGWWRAHWQI